MLTNKELKQAERFAKRLHLVIYETMAKSSSLSVSRAAFQIVVGKLEQSGMPISADAIRQILKVL
jgi:hypothetical protein